MSRRTVHDYGRDSNFIDAKIKKLKNRANRRGFGFDLDRPRLARMYLEAGDNCPCCRRPFRIKGDSIPSIDRLDNNRGYVRDNLVIICRDCNNRKAVIEGSGLSSKKDVRDKFFEDYFYVIAFMNANNISTQHLDFSTVADGYGKAVSLKEIADMLSRCTVAEKVQVLSMMS